MKKTRILCLIMSLLLITSMLSAALAEGETSDRTDTLQLFPYYPVMETEGTKGSASVNWIPESIQYDHFTDIGNYVVAMNPVNYADAEKAIEYMHKYQDPFNGGCTAVIKLNSEGEVIVGRNMDITFSQTPAFISRVTGGQYETISIYYGGDNFYYTYSQLAELDRDEELLSTIPYCGTDAMNEAGLYIEMNMRNPEPGYERFVCSGTNPGKPRVCLISAATLACANCATVPEVLAYLRDSYDWYAVGFNTEGTTLCWNLSMLIGDAEGNRGLVEFAMNNIYYTPYPNGQSNYYVHPDLAEYSTNGAGYGRLSASLLNLELCETEWDMLHNMELSMLRTQMLALGSFGYSDYENDINKRRAQTTDELQEGYERMCAPFRVPVALYYLFGDDSLLRTCGTIWTTAFNIGVNCAKKHLVLRLWEADNSIFQYQW